MPVSFECDKCKNKIETSGKNIGITIMCPSCQGSVVVPNPNKSLQVVNIKSSEPPPLPSVSIITEWYYSAGNKKIGPISEEIIRQLINSGVVTRETKVWREGMENWSSASETELNPTFKISSPPFVTESQCPPIKRTLSKAKYIITGCFFIIIILISMTIKFVPAAENKLGFYYEKGIIVPKNERKALEWYTKAANKGNPDSENSLGHFYKQGIVVPKDEQKAVE
ncbi:MAG TPA: GYF domain-containing protein, partial [Methanosarcina vacuolata]|nr:GYF domain-containing protein [Methanosarcina vacuolata]